MMSDKFDIDETSDKNLDLDNQPEELSTWI